MIKKVIKSRLIALICIGMMAIAGAQTAKAQFDEAPRNFWTLDLQLGGAWGNSPKIHTPSGNKLGGPRVENAYGNDGGFPLSLTFGVNHRLFSNFYFGVHFGYKYNYGEAGGTLYKYSNVKEHSAKIKLNYHLLILPIEIGYNHSFSHKNGLNVYISAIPGYCLSASASTEYDDSSDKYCAVKNPELCIDAAIGLKYYIRHFFVGVSYHYGLNDGQKQIDKMGVIFPIGYRF